MIIDQNWELDIELKLRNESNDRAAKPNYSHLFDAARFSFKTDVMPVFSYAERK